MAYDGIFINAQIDEIRKYILNEHISKITQSSYNEVSFRFHKNGIDWSLSLNTNPNFPHIIYWPLENENMKTPTSFCMLLRKYLQGGIIRDIALIGKNTKINEINIDEKSLERIIRIRIENIDENGDLTYYFIFFEIMGKYSNIILTNENLTILDLLHKSNIDNARLKAKNIYRIDDVATKLELYSETYDNFIRNINSEKTLSKVNNESFNIVSAVSKIYAGISKQYVQSVYISFMKTINGNYSYQYDISTLDDFKLFFDLLKSNIKNEVRPMLFYKNEKPIDLYVFNLNQYENNFVEYKTINELVYNYVKEKHSSINISNDKYNLLNAIEKINSKLYKKLEIYESDLLKCNDLDKYKNYAELISAFGYNENNIKNDKLICEDYNNNNSPIEIPIDRTLPIPKNVEKYYKKYDKLKRTKENAEKLIAETKDKIDHLDTIRCSISLTDNTYDLYLIKEELIRYFDESHTIHAFKTHENNIKKRNSNKKSQINYNISHYKSTNGIDIFVGKNNLQNEYLTFTQANSSDTWLHVKNATGSHVIIKKPYENLDDQTLIEAASLAAYFSEKRNDTKVTVDYTLRKELKKVKGKSPGFCIYHKNYSINVKPEIIIKEIK